MQNPMIDGESQPQQKPNGDDQVDGHENRIVILKKQPVDGEKHEELGSSQLADLPMKELQGQLAAAAAALNAQHNQDVQNRFDEEAKQKNMERPDSDLFKSIEQPGQAMMPEVSEVDVKQQSMMPTASQEPMMPEIPEVDIKQQPMMPEVPEVDGKQQPVEPAPITNEHNQEEINEQVRVGRK